MSASTPTIIAGRYELQRRLATGGMAEVWLATDLTLDRRVAVKWLKPTLATDPIVAERFRREAIAAASLNHPNIVAVHDVFEQDGRQAVVMQLVDGKSLRQLLDTRKRLSPELTCHIGSAVAVALDVAHQAGFVHRDVKPGNIMITPDGRVLLTDFGIAKGLHGESGDDLTSDNIMMGTAKYLSPEQVRGKKLDGRADLYSLGLVLYECLAGRVPFLGESDADTALARLQRDPTDLARLRATLPTRLVAVIHSLLARNPDHRPASGADLVVELKAAASEGSPAIDGTNPEQSPVAPFAAGRLVRAPSDLRGRADDRSRGMRSPTPPTSGDSPPSRSTPTPPSRSTPTPPRGKNHRDSPSRPTRRPGDRRRGQGFDASPASAPRPGRMIGPIQPRDASSVTSGRIPIVGEPDRSTGRVPVQPATSTSRQPVASRATPPRDGTPPSGTPMRGAPARGMAQKWGPSSTVVGVLVAAGIVVAILLWTTINFGGGDPSTSTTILPGDQAGAATDSDDTESADAGVPEGADPAADGAGDPAQDGDAAIDEPATAVTVAPSIDPADVRIAAIVAYDPEGDGSERDELAADALVDGNPATGWRTVCYSGEYMGGKTGVGLVVSLDGEAQRPLELEVTNSPYIIEFRGSTDVDVPAGFDGWGEPFGYQYSAVSGDGASIDSGRPPTAVRHILILLKQLGSDADCSSDNPYRGGLAEITLAG